MATEKPISRRTKEFKDRLSRLPGRVQETAMERYRNYFSKDPFHPLLCRHDLYDVRDAPKESFAVEMAYGYRAVGRHIESENTYVWYWCGSHAEYDIRFAKGR